MLILILGYLFSRHTAESGDYRTKVEDDKAILLLKDEEVATLHFDGNEVTKVILNLNKNTTNIVKSIKQQLKWMGEYNLLFKDGSFYVSHGNIEIPIKDTKLELDRYFNVTMRYIKRTVFKQKIIFSHPF